MAVKCAQCGAPNQPDEKFCGECGAALNAGVQTLEPERSRLAPREAGGERRHLTVLFCDLVGSTGIAAQLDPEEWRQMMADYHRTAGEAITRFGGHVAKYLGDGVMAFFGYPEAHDNDAERATRAGLAIIDAIAKLDEQPGLPRLAARIGIDSGAVVVGVAAGHEADVFGDAPNIAARVQEAAVPGSVTVTEGTHRLISGLFVVERVGAPPLKGVQRPIQLYRVVQPSGVRGRLEAAAVSRGLTQFVGREDELRLLMSRWERTLDGEGQVALIMGEAGIGKSRLVRCFSERIAATPHTWLQSAAGVFSQNTPFFPIAEMLRQALTSRGAESKQEQLAQLEAVIERAGLQSSEAVPLIAPLIDVSVPAKYPPSRLSPDQQRRRLLATLVELALGTARMQPTVIAIEDLHWADPSTLELVQLLVEQGERARLFLIYTARPEFHVQWPLRAHHTQITLNRLSARNVRVMVREVAARKALSDEIVAAVVERTGGVPLFVEELTRAVLESGNTMVTGREIPVTLHDSLMARLDRLGPGKEVVQIGAVIGEEFTYELLHAIHPLGEEELQRALRNLADAELVYVRGIAPEATYLFKHALIRDAAYEALLKSRRRDLHRQVADTIQKHFTPLSEAHPEVLARHWTEAGETEAAITQWSKAGQAFQARHAFREALESYQQAVALLKLLPASPERDLRDVELARSVVWMLQVTKGYSAPETIEATERSAALAEKLGNLKQLVNWIMSKFVGLYVAGDFPAADALADQVFELGLREGSPASLGGAHLAQMFMREAFREDLAGVERHFTEWLKYFEDPDLRQYPGALVAPFGIAIMNAFLIGRPSEARAREAQMMAAVEGGNPYDQAFALNYASGLRLWLREYEEAEALAAQALELAEKNQFPLGMANSRCNLGDARAQLGRETEGIALIRQGLAGLLEVGSRLDLGLISWRLAEAQAHGGAITDALETLEQVLQDNPRFSCALTLRAELRHKQGQTELAEADLRQALALAREFGAKSLEMRTALSFARLFSNQGRREEARSMLAEIYSWFTDGFDTADLKDAKVLLDELRQ
jgi:class 3 adenylate cyclase/tetratricopeptide (TPR) repeat protein